MENASSESNQNGSKTLSIETQKGSKNNKRLNKPNKNNIDDEDLYSVDYDEENDEEDDEEDDYDEDEEEDEEEEEDYDEQTQKKDLSSKKKKRQLKTNDLSTFQNKTKKKQRLTGKQYLDVEAAVGDDDEFEDDDEDDMDTLDEAAAAQAAEKELDLGARRRIMGDLEKSEYHDSVGHLASTIGDLERRYQHQEFEIEEEEEDIEESEPEEEEEEYSAYFKDQSETLTELMPNLQNIKLWVVQTNKGFLEKEIVVNIMNKAIHFFEKGLQFPILSVFAADGIRGRIYVEADNVSQIIECLSGFQSININNIKIVPSHEVAVVYSMGVKLKKPLTRNELVRFRGGLYAGDLGQIVEYDDITSSATVRVVPRLDLEEIMSRQFKTSTEKKTKRPFPKLLNKEEIEIKGGDYELGPVIGTFKFDGKTFEDSGFLLRKVQPRNFLVGDDVAATAEEIKAFSNLDSLYLNSSNPEIEASVASLSAILNKPSAKTTNYAVGDSVVFQSTELTGLKGRVVSIDEKSVSVMIDALNKKIIAAFNEIVKSFDIGDSVKVIAGQHAGKSGLVIDVNLKAGSATIFWPELGCPIESNLNELQQCSNSGLGLGGLKTLSGFSIDDLVLLSNQDTGVIIRIDPGGAFSVITTDNKVGTFSSAQLVSKRSNAFAYALDASGNQFSIKSSVTVVNQPYKNQSGRVKHIWKDHIFVKLTNKEIVNGGYFVCKGNDLKVSAFDISSTPSIPSNPLSKSQHARPYRGGGHYHNNQMQHHAGSKGGNWQRKNANYHGKDNRPKHIGARVKLIGTRHKGSYGKIIAIIDNETYRISLESSSVVDVSKSEILLLDGGRVDFGNPRSFSHRNSNQWNSYFDSIKKKSRFKSVPASVKL